MHQNCMKELSNGSHIMDERLTRRAYTLIVQHVDDVCNYVRWQNDNQADWYSCSPSRSSRHHGSPHRWDQKYAWHHHGKQDDEWWALQYLGWTWVTKTLVEVELTMKNLAVTLGTPFPRPFPPFQWPTLVIWSCWRGWVECMKQFVTQEWQVWWV